MPSPADRPRPPGRRAPDSPYTDDEREAVRSRHAAGMGRNAIGRDIPMHQRKVSAIAAELGLSFARSKHTRAATEAKKVDAKAKRAQLALDLLDDAARMRQELWQPCIAWNFGGKDNTFSAMPVDRPSFKDRQLIMAAVSIASKQALELERYDADTDGGDAKSVIGDLMTGLKQAWQDAKAE